MTKDYTAYPEEDEVLVQDGFAYLITGFDEQEDKKTGWKYTVVGLKYPVE